MAATMLASSSMTARPVCAARLPTRNVAGNVAGLRSRSVGIVSTKQRGVFRVMANEKQGKGGEEGGRKFGDDAFGKLAKSPRFTLLASSVTKAGLEPALMGEGPITLFAPDDDSFVAAAKTLGITKVELLALPNLGDILKNHVVNGLVKSSDLKEGQEIETLSGYKLKFSVKGGVSVNGIKVTKPDFAASNGVIHVINQVLL